MVEAMGLVRSGFESKDAMKWCAEEYEKCLEVKSHSLIFWYGHTFENCRHSLIQLMLLK